MKFRVTSFIMPKSQCKDSECEDTYFYDAQDKLRFAISDGASNSSYSTVWAELLVRNYVECDNSDWQAHMRALQQKWYEWYAGINWSDLPWNCGAKAMEGDSATLLGLTFSSYDVNNGNWEALAIGDSCLFHVRSNEFVSSFPLHNSNDFNDFPALICSIDSNIGNRVQAIKFIKGNYQIGDIFIMATDAIAEWFLNSHEAGEKPWLDLVNLSSNTHFRGFIETLRQHGRIEDDDVTILIIIPQSLALAVI